MRIIAGRFRSRKLRSPPERTQTRPLPDRVRESIFNLLRGHFEGAVVFDGFAGVGSFGLEALSRGAERVVMVEKDKRVGKVLQANVDSLGVGDRSEIVLGDALGPACLARCPTPINIALLDPPYQMVRTLEGWNRVRTQLARIVALLSDDGYAMVRTPWPFTYRPTPKHPLGQSESAPGTLIIDGMDALEDDALDALEAELLGPDQARPLDMDLSLAGAVGPETHVYKNTAVHLYMRDRGCSP